MHTSTHLDAKWSALQPSMSFSVALHSEYLVSHSTQATCPLMDASCRAVYPTHDFLFRFRIPWIFRNLKTKMTRGSDSYAGEVYALAARGQNVRHNKVAVTYFIRCDVRLADGVLRTCIRKGIVQYTAVTLEKRVDFDDDDGRLRRYRCIT